MTDQAYTGFRFEWERPDLKDKERIRVAECLVVARSEEEAMLVMISAITGTRMGVRLIAQGDDVLKEAHDHDIANGEGREVTPSAA